MRTSFFQALPYLPSIDTLKLTFKLKGGEDVNTEKKPILLGILGGLGPMSGVYFCEMLTSHTQAACDSQHINFLLSSRANTPDRSSFILGKSKNDPTPVMIEEAKRLENAGANIIAIPCNTAHYFYKSICDAVSIPIINIIEETADFCKHEGLERVAVLATEGTIASGAYCDVFNERGIDILALTKDEQALVTSIIFDQIKKGLAPNVNDFVRLCDDLKSRGCERVILGCTELSLIKKEYEIPDFFIDSLEVLTLRAILKCNKQPIGFDEPLMNYYAQARKEDLPLCY